MNKQSLTGMWDMMRLRHGVGLRCIEAIPADQFDARPIASMRTPKELIAHMYGFLRQAPEGVVAGTLSASPDEKATAAGLKTKADVLRYADDCWKAADAAFAKITDAQLGAMVPTPWNESYPGHVMVNFVNDEFLHHRGQLYAYIRALGGEPPMLWDFEHNAPEYQPKQHTSA